MKRMFDYPGLRKKTCAIAACALLAAVLLSLAGCSAVFEAGISGTLKDKDSGDGIPGVSVYAYTDEGLRDRDYARGATPKADGYGLTFNPSTGGNYIPITSTDGQGRFTIGKLLWKTDKPEFGKTADYQDIYLLYFHPDYGLVKEPTRVTVVSDSNNSSRVQTTMTSRLKSKELRITIKDVADMDNAATGFSVQVKSFLLDKEGNRYQENGKDKEYDKQTQTVTGSGTFVIPYLADEAEGKTEIEVKIIPDSESTWSWVNGPTYKEDGSLDNDDCFKLEDDNIDIADADDKIRDEDAPRVDQALYVKNYKFDVPTINGTVATEPTAADNEYLDVWLAEVSKIEEDGKKTLKVIDKVTTTHEGDGANSGMVQYGVFTGLGADLEWEPDLTKGDYKGPVANKDFYLIIDRLVGGKTDAKPTTNDWLRKIAVDSNSDATQNVYLSPDRGKVFLSNTTANDDYYIVDVEEE